MPDGRDASRAPGSILGRAIADLGAASMASLIVIGDRLGLYRALAVAGPLTAAELAMQTGTNERYIREWLNAHAASGYVNYISEKGLYELTMEQAMVFAEEGGPAFLVGGFQAALAAGRSVDALTNAFCSGEGIAWDEHHPDLSHGTANFNRISHNQHLLRDWIPQIQGLEGKLKAGIDVVDVGCGLAHSTEMLAKAFPKSRFVGVDNHVASIAAATRRLTGTSLTNVSLELADADRYRGSNYELVTMFNALHDVGNPTAVAQHILNSLRPGGTWMVVEPYAGDRIEENLNLIGRVHYSQSTLMSIPSSLSQEGGAGLGTQAGEARVREVAMNAGFKHFRRTCHTAWSMVFEARA